MIAVDDGTCHLRLGVVAAGCPLYEVFFFDVAVNREVVIRREKDVIVRGITRDARSGNRSGYHRVGYFCSRGKRRNEKGQSDQDCNLHGEHYDSPKRGIATKGTKGFPRHGLCTNGGESGWLRDGSIPLRFQGGVAAPQ